MFTQLCPMALTRTGRVQWASSWSNAQRRDTISQPASLPIAKASTPPRSFSHAFTARFVGPSMNGLPRKPGCARPRCPRDHLAQALQLGDQSILIKRETPKELSSMQTPANSIPDVLCEAVLREFCQHL